MLVLQAVNGTDSSNSTALDALKDKLAEKAAVYADLDAQYQEAVRAQF